MFNDTLKFMTVQLDQYGLLGGPARIEPILSNKKKKQQKQILVKPGITLVHNSVIWTTNTKTIQFSQRKKAAYKNIHELHLHNKDILPSKTKHKKGKLHRPREQSLQLLD